eukprot:m.36196 g.36196  ORF g.36196 m.36196 type:complete len:125 (+) comp14462_c0_seq1:57-431(+)
MAKCHRTGKSVYPMDNPVKINDMVFSKAGFTCACGCKMSLTLNNYIVKDGDVYFKNHAPKDVPSSDAGLDLNTAHMMNSQAVSSGAHVKGSGYTGAEASGYSAIPEHITKAKENGSGFSGVRAV